jgi:hypothetical protein
MSDDVIEHLAISREGARLGRDLAGRLAARSSEAGGRRRQIAAFQGPAPKSRPPAGASARSEPSRLGGRAGAG